MFTYYKDLLGKLYLKKGEGPIKRLTNFGFEISRNSSKLRPPTAYPLRQDIFLSEISEEEFFDATKWQGIGRNIP